jgi:hypothetical protein
MTVTSESQANKFIQRQIRFRGKLNSEGIL